MIPRRVSGKRLGKMRWNLLGRCLTTRCSSCPQMSPFTRQEVEILAFEVHALIRALSVISGNPPLQCKKSPLKTGAVFKCIEQFARILTPIQMITPPFLFQFITSRLKARDGHRYPCPALEFPDGSSEVSRAVAPEGTGGDEVL